MSASAPPIFCPWPVPVLRSCCDPDVHVGGRSVTEPPVGATDEQIGTEFDQPSATNSSGMPYS